MKIETTIIEGVLQKYFSNENEKMVINNIITELKDIQGREIMVKLADTIILEKYKNVPNIKDLNINPMLHEYYTSFDPNIELEVSLSRVKHSIRQDILGLVAFELAKSTLGEFTEISEVEVEYNKDSYLEGHHNDNCYHEFYEDFTFEMKKVLGWSEISSIERAEFCKIVVGAVSILLCDKDYDLICTWYELSDAIATKLSKNLPFGWEATELIK